MAAYYPRFVTETDEKYWTDCVWASTVMGIDKWTNGLRVDREALRKASGDLVGGSTFADVQKGVANYAPTTKLAPLYAPYITPDRLLVLLGGTSTHGFVVNGLYKALVPFDGGRYVRWDKTFATKPDGYHSVYVQATDPNGNRKAGYAWWMDPLGRNVTNAAGVKTIYKGEWVPHAALKAFVKGCMRTSTAIYAFMFKDGEKRLVAFPVQPVPTPDLAAKVKELEAALAKAVAAAAAAQNAATTAEARATAAELRLQRIRDALI